VAEFGEITSVFVLGFILASLTELGFANYFQRRTASDVQKSIEDFNSALTLRFITYFIVLFISIAYNYYWGAAVELLLIVFIVTSVFVFNTNWLLIKIFYGLNEYFSVFKRFLVSRFILIAGSSLLIFTDISLSIFSMVFLVSALSEFVLLSLLLKQKKSYSFKPEIKGKILKRIFASSVPMGLGIFFVVVYDRVDILLIQRIIGSESVGIYAVAYSLYKIPHIFSGIFLTPLYSDLSAEFESKQKIDYEKIKRIGLILVIISIISMILFFFLSDILIEIIYGKRYLHSADILKLLVIAMPFLFLNNLTGVTLNSIRKEKLAFYSAAIATLFNLLLNILLLNLIGIVGAIVSTILTELLIFLIQLNYIMKFKFDSYKENFLPKK
jgi:O-antigen/teichoic acid export membrane protein